MVRTPPRSRRLTRGSRLRSIARLLGAGLLGAGCCVAPPRNEDWLAVGYRTPAQSIGTFQTAVRADSPDLEYRCFSSGFRMRNGISKMVWKEAREKLRREYPWLRKGLTDARIEGEVEVRGNRAVALMVTHGEWIRMGLVREDYAMLWSGDRLLSDEEGVVFEAQTIIQTGADGRYWSSGWIGLPPGAVAQPDVTEIHIGREWKIDAFEMIEEPQSQPTTHIPPAPEATPPEEEATARAQAPHREDA